jgi:hypothetical protein
MESPSYQKICSVLKICPLGYLGDLREAAAWFRSLALWALVGRFPAVPRCQVYVSVTPVSRGGRGRFGPHGLLILAAPLASTEGLLQLFRLKKKFYKPAPATLWGELVKLI